MPFFRRRFPFRRASRRRTFRRRRRGTNYARTQKTTASRAAMGLVPYTSIAPSARLVRMRYALNAGLGHALASATGAVVDFVYRAHDGYDPYFGAGGAQPRGFDQLMALYRHGVCVKSTLHVEFGYTESAAAKYAMIVGVLLKDTGTTLGVASQADIAEHHRCKHKMLVPVSGNKISMRYVYTPQSMFSVKDAQDEADLYFTSGASPSEVACFHIFGWALSANTEEAFFTGYIDYDFVLLHPIEPSQS